MRALYAAFVLSLAVLLWTVIAAARYIRRHAAGRERQAETAEENPASSKQDTTENPL